MKTICSPARMIHGYKSIPTANVPLADVPVALLTAERNREHTVHADGAESHAFWSRVCMNVFHTFFLTWRGGGR